MTPRRRPETYRREAPSGADDGKELAHANAPHARRAGADRVTRRRTPPIRVPKRDTRDETREPGAEGELARVPRRRDRCGPLGLERRAGRGAGAGRSDVLKLEAAPASLQLAARGDAAVSATTAPRPARCCASARARR